VFISLSPNHFQALLPIMSGEAHKPYQVSTSGIDSKKYPKTQRSFSSGPEKARNFGLHSVNNVCSLQGPTGSAPLASKPANGGFS
jgi:hypothetical protein